MAPDERSRVEASQALTEQLGPAAAAALMECIPPYGWHEIATKRDLADLERRIALRFEALEARLSAQIAGVDAQAGARWRRHRPRLGPHPRRDPRPRGAAAGGAWDYRLTTLFHLPVFPAIVRA